jgi:hypothetical protein
VNVDIPEIARIEREVAVLDPVPSLFDCGHRLVKRVTARQLVVVRVARRNEQYPIAIVRRGDADLCVGERLNQRVANGVPIASIDKAAIHNRLRRFERGSGPVV